jgi:hypothetical protein
MAEKTIANQAVGQLGTLDKFSTTTNGTRAFIVDLLQEIKTIPLGSHSHAIIENLGTLPTSTVELCQSGQRVAWIEAGKEKLLDGHTDTTIFLACATGFGTAVRITLWG